MPSGPAPALELAWPEPVTGDLDPPSIRTLAGTAAALAPALALAGCGGSDGGSSTPAPTGGTVTTQSVTETQASRLLAQGTMGASRAAIADVVGKGFDGWLAAQFATARATTLWGWLSTSSYNTAANINSTNGWDAAVWRASIVEPDQLRQRVGQALLDMMVVGITGLTGNWRQFQMAAYMDVLLDNAFGNFRTLMDAITTNAAMASFLTFLNNRKAVNGSQPDENYARELMQLFTIGLYQLNMDGTLKLSGGKPVETYSQTDVSQLARVFTGLSLAAGDATLPDRYRLPLVMNASINETGSSTFLGATTSGGGMAAIKVALDTIFAHPNVPPFVSRQLIQRLVTSNPSAAYVGRVAAVFADNGSGVRGDLKAVVRAILLDDEARNDAGLASPSGGKVREPIVRLTGWARAFNVNSASNAWAIGDTSSQATRIGESPGRSATVFNWFRPGYSPPNSGVSSAGLVAPELQLANEISVVAYINYLQTLIGSGTGDVLADYSAILTKAGDSQALVDEVNLVLAAGQLSSATVAAIKAAVDSIASTGTTGPGNRVATAILLTMASPDYLVLR